MQIITEGINAVIFAAPLWAPRFFMSLAMVIVGAILMLPLFVKTRLLRIRGRHAYQMAHEEPLVVLILTSAGLMAVACGVRTLFL
jgi:hypothetical protein